MPMIEVDAEVFRALEAKVGGFGETPNTVLRRVLRIGEVKAGPSPMLASAIQSPTAAVMHPVSHAKTARGKAPKASLSDLIRQGSLSEGQTLYLHDYRGNKVDGFEARIKSDDLEYRGRIYSMSALTRELMQGQGFKSDEYRGPHFWYTAQRRSVRDLWESHLRGVRG